MLDRIGRNLAVLCALASVALVATSAATAGAQASGDGYIGNRVWSDDDANGRQDSGEPGVQGVAVELIDARSGVRVAGGFTGAGGWFGFRGLETNACYRVRVEAPTGFDFTVKDSANDTQDSDVDPADGLMGWACLDGLHSQFWWDAGLVPEDVVAPNPTLGEVAPPQWVDVRIIDNDTVGLRWDQAPDGDAIGGYLVEDNWEYIEYVSGSTGQPLSYDVEPGSTHRFHVRSQLRNLVYGEPSRALRFEVGPGGLIDETNCVYDNTLRGFPGGPARSPSDRGRCEVRVFSGFGGVDGQFAASQIDGSIIRLCSEAGVCEDSLEWELLGDIEPGSVATRNEIEQLPSGTIRSQLFVSWRVRVDSTSG